MANGLSALSGMSAQQIQALNQQYGSPQLSMGGAASPVGANPNMTHYGPANAGVSVQDFGGGYQDNLQRAGLMKRLGGNPYFPGQQASPGFSQGGQAAGGVQGGNAASLLGGSAGAGQAVGGQATLPGAQPGAQAGGAQQIPSGTSGFMTTNPTAQPGAPKYGLSGAEEAMQRGLQGGLAGLEAGVNQAGNTLQPYTQGGNSAFNLQSALSGAMGPEAQRQAFANYNESPEVAYQREMGERAITRNAAATGGLGGSRVQQELQRHAIGLAQQDYGNSFNRLGTLADKGYGAAGLLGGIQANAGGQAGQMAYGTGQAMAAGRTRAGEQIAGNVQGTSSSLAQLLNQQGTDLSSIIGTQGGNIANLLAGYGTADAQTQQALAALLANIATGSASQVAGVPGLPGVNDPGVLGGLGNLLGGIGTFAKSPANPWG